MKAIIRKNDNVVINLRQGGDWNGYSKLATVQDAYKALPPNTDPEVKAKYEAMIAGLLDDFEAYKAKRVQAVVNSFGGIPGDYECVDIPTGQESDFITASFVEYDGSNFTYHANPLYAVEDSAITVNPRWVVGNTKLETADVTDFSGEVYTEDMNFKLSFFQDDASKEISVELFLWTDAEDPVETVTGKTHKGDICTGRINYTDNSITIL